MELTAEKKYDLTDLTEDTCLCSSTKSDLGCDDTVIQKTVPIAFQSIIKAN
jgi:hypothetical protein